MNHVDVFFQSDVCARINDYRPMKNRRVGILPFVTYFSVCCPIEKTNPNESCLGRLGIL